MIMESPVRIYLGAALVVTILLLCSTTANGGALPEPTATTREVRITSRFSRTNTTLATTRKSKTPDVALNELHPKDSVLEEHTEKNAKYKDRGRVRYNLKPSTESSIRRIRTSTIKTAAPSSTGTPKLIIVTPTPEIKKPAQIIDGMKTFKKTKMPVSSSTTPMPVSSSTTPMPKSVASEEEEEEYEDDEEEEVTEPFEKYTSGKFDSNFFTIPNYNIDFHHDSVGSDNKVKSEYSSSPYNSFSSYFPEVSYDPNYHDKPYKVEDFFNFDSDLTTPKNDFFDKKFHEISSSIIKNLDTIRSKQPPTPSTTNTYKVIKENMRPTILSNVSPKNQSTVIFKNTKEIRLLDNDEAGTANNKELSDVHGTSIYYEVSVLSTETYNLNSNDDDCDNDTLPADPTASTSVEQELVSLKTTQPTLLSSMKVAPKDLKSEKSEAISTLSPNYLPFLRSDSPLFGTATPSSIPVSTQNSVSSTEKSKRMYSSSITRNRSYSKRLNASGANDSPNNVTPRVESSTVQQVHRVPTRKFHYTTPKTKPVWMAPRRNVTRTSYTRSTIPTTIYSEYFSIKDKLSTTTPRSKQSSRTSLTTVSSEIDPVLQSDVSGVKKIVHSQAISDNSIPTLWKRGSTKFSSSTALPAEVESDTSDMEIPPTLTAWALASLRSTPVQASPTINVTAATQKSIDENELQKVGQMTDKKETTTTSTTTTTTGINNAIISEKYTELIQNRQPWRPAKPIIPPSTTNLITSTVTESKLEKQPAESNISFQSSAKHKASTENMNVGSTGPTIETEKELVQALKNTETTTEEVQETIPPVDAPKSTGFESITKLPAGMTTPHDETTGSDPSHDVTEAPTTTDYEITTIRFSYVPTETTESQEKVSTSNWHTLFPTRTKSTTIKDEPITTYRPKYITSTDVEVETTTVILETTPGLELSSQVVEHVTEIPLTILTAKTTEEVDLQNETTTEKLTVRPMTTTNRTPVETTPVPTTEEFVETTTIIVEIATEINSERSKLPTTSTEVSLSTEISSIEVTETTPSEFRDSSSEENSGSNEVITQETTKMSPSVSTTIRPRITTVTTQETITENEEPTTVTDVKPTTTQTAKISEMTQHDTTLESTTDITTTEDLSNFNVEVTTEASSRVLSEDSGSGAAVAIAVSTIGVIALILLVGLLLVVRRRGRRGVYAQRCTPVSLDAYSLDSVSVGHRKGNQRLRASKRSYGNPAYDDEVTSHPMQYAALANFALDVDSMSTEFAEIPSVTVRPDEVPPGCEDKNRYSNVLPLPETRVPLKRIGNDHTSEYINANYITGPGNIKGYYIACQAPLHNTVVDFWRMVWEQNSRVIVMLTEYMENGVEKCYEYLPPSEVSDNKRTFGEYQIILMKREQRDKYAISSVQVINLATRTWREVTHLWYFWPAKGVPDDYESVLEFLSEMRSYMKIAQTAKEYDEEGVEVIYGDQNRSSFHNLSKLRSDENNSGNGVNVYSPARAEEQLRRGNTTNGTLSRMKAASEVEGVRPCVVMCASGAGRSAAMIAVDICTRALAAGIADVPRVVRELRAQRPHSLSNRHHYIFLYKVLSEYGNKLMGGGVDTI